MFLTVLELGGLTIGTPYPDMKFTTLGRQIYTLTVLTNNGTNVTYTLTDIEGNVSDTQYGFVDTQVFEVNAETWPNPNIP